MENCKVHELSVEAYLKELLTILPGVTDPEAIPLADARRIAAAGRTASRRGNHAA